MVMQDAMEDHTDKLMHCAAPVVLVRHLDKPKPTRCTSYNQPSWNRDCVADGLVLHPKPLMLRLVSLRNDLSYSTMFG